MRLFLFFISFSFASSTATRDRIKRNAEELHSVLDELRGQIRVLKSESDANNLTLQDVLGFINVIKFGIEDTKDQCGNEMNTNYEEDRESRRIKWVLNSPHTCVKILPQDHTMDQAHTACHEEFQPDHDIDYPQVLSVRSAKENTALIQLLRSRPDVTSIWILGNGGNGQNYSNWAAGSLSANGGHCIETRNSLNPAGKWIDVSCTRVNHVICEKTVSVSYSELVRQQIDLMIEFKEHAKNRGQPSAESIIQQNQTKLMLNVNTLLERSEQKLKGDYVRVARRLEQLSEKNGQIETQFAGVETNLVRNTGKINVIETKLNNLNSRSVQDKIAGYELQLSSLKKELEIQKLKILSVERKNQDLVSKFDGFISSRTISAAETERKLTEALNRINTLQSQSTSTSAPNWVNSVNSNMNKNKDVYDYDTGFGDNFME